MSILSALAYQSNVFVCENTTKILILKCFKLRDVRADLNCCASSNMERKKKTKQAKERHTLGTLDICQNIELSRKA